MSESSTTEEILRKMRSGYSMSHTIKYGEMEFEVRLIPGDEELRIVDDVKAELAESAEKKKVKATDDAIKLGVMKEILHQAGTVNGKVSTFPHAMLSRLSTAEVEALYARYLDILYQVDVEFLEIDHNKIAEIIEDVRKKKQNPRELSTRYLAMIGLCFLVDLLPKVSEPGS